MTLRRRDWNYRDELYSPFPRRKPVWQPIEGLGEYRGAGSRYDHEATATPIPEAPVTTGRTLPPRTHGPADLVGRVTGPGQVPSLVTLSLLGAFAGWLLAKRPVEGALVGAGVAVVLPMVRGAPAAPAVAEPPRPHASGQAPSSR